MGILVFVGLAALAGFAGWLSFYLKKKRRDELALMARQLGLDYSTADTQGCLGLPFQLLAKGDGRGTENVLWGEWQGIPIREFDYWYYEESTDGQGRRSRTYYRFSCASTFIDAQCAPLTIERENLFSRMADHLGFSDIAFESEEFNRAFNVKCRDRKFATDILDPRMMEWLLSAGGGWGFEVSDRYLLCFSKKRRPTELVPLIGTLRAFRDRVPRVVYELYGSGAAR